MRFFKYLVFLLISIVSVNSYSAVGYRVNPDYGFTTPFYSTKDQACAAFFALKGGNSYKAYSNECYINPFGFHYFQEGQLAAECWHPDYKVVQQSAKSQVRKSICIRINGVMCKYTGDPNPDVIVNDYFTTIFSSVSKTPDPDCQEELVNPPCDPKDPYGGCFTPPNQECTRQFNGSIECPPDVQPKVQKGCSNGATYCKRPPEGCGEGYVSGSFNGEALCVKSGPSSPPNPDDGGGASEPTGNNSNTSTSTSTSTSSSSSGDGTGGVTNVTNINNNTNNTTVNVDVAGIINAVKNMKETLNVSLSTLNDKVKTVSDTLTGTNQKLDTANTTLNSINQKNQVTNDKLQELIDKPNGTSQGDFDGSGIIDSVNSFKDKFIEFFGTERDTSDLEQIGQESNDPRSNGARDNATSAFQNLANVLTFSNSSCVPDLEINNIPLFHSVVIPLSKWCDLLAMVKILLHLGVLLTALRMVTDTVRVI
jgi:hypothetical protein